MAQIPKRTLFGISLLIVISFSFYTIFEFGESPQGWLGTPNPPIAKGKLQPNRVASSNSPNTRLHRYKFTVKADTYFQVSLTQLEADLILEIRDPAKQLLCRQDSFNQDVGLEKIDWIAKTSGDFFLDVLPIDPETRGRYKLSLETNSNPTNIQRQRVQAFKMLLRARNMSRGQNLEAVIEAFEEARLMKISLGELEDNALILLEQALLFENDGQFHRALDKYELALEIYKNLPVEWGRKMAGSICHTLGFVHSVGGQYEASLQYNASALRYHNEPDPNRVETLIERAFIFGLCGAYFEGQAFLDEAAQILQAHPHAYLQFRLLVQRGTLQNLAGFPARAIGTFEKALSHQKKHRIRADSALLDRFSKALFELGDYDRAEDFLNAAKNYTDNPRSIAILDCNLAEVLLEKGEPQKAAIHLEKAYTTLKNLENPQTLAFYYFQKAKVEEDFQNMDQAIENVQKALNLSERIRRNAKSQSMKASHKAAHHEYLDYFVDLQMKAGGRHVESALLKVDHSRAQNLVSRLRQPKTKKNQDPNFQEIKQQISELAWELSQNDPIDPRDQQKLDALLWRYNQIQDNQGVEAGANVDPIPLPQLSLEEIQQLLDPKTVVLYYAMGLKNIWLLRLDGKTLVPYFIPGRESIENHAIDFYRAVKSRNTAKYRQTVKSKARALAERLLPEGVLPDKESRLVIVSDGNLHFLPFAALPNPSSQTPLIEDYEIVNLNSLSVLAALRDRPPIQVPPKDIVVFADPLYRKDGPFPDLPYSRQEAEMLRSMGGPGTRVLMGSDAKKANILNGVSGFSICHFATHGLSLSDQGDLSAVVLADRDSEGHPIDGYLRAHEIAATPIQANLVVLSSCRSALGQHTRGEGFSGLPQSFLEAGAKAVIAGLWNLQDRASWIFMSHFYRLLLEDNLTPSNALRQAQITMWRTQEYSEPYFWAGYQFQGDWRALDNKMTP